ncbi:hypothetical protein SAMN05216337_105113 [Bradyrhizobium brasilense]|uniref:Uncharacterized protein n=1 Tax=Bradyrhizobium brasilense TaxID=1419277 RepID=A0A1G7K339_9BRAD|nr:hypothetical protein SAMN05216337_105113 [Bradyrhizobium brasilense]
MKPWRGTRSPTPIRAPGSLTPYKITNLAEESIDASVCSLLL